MSFQHRRCAGCRKLKLMYSGERFCARYQENQRRRANGECTAALHHGPGHQSTTYCELPSDKHPLHKGRKQHMTHYCEMRAYWTGWKRSTGDFDEPPGGD